MLRVPHYLVTSVVCDHGCMAPPDKVQHHKPSSGDPVIDAVLGTAHLMRETTNVELQTCGLSLWTFKALRALDELGPTRSVDLSDRLGIAARTVTGAVDALEADGLVERQPHPTDRRAHLLVVTQRGRERLADATQVHQSLVKSAGGALTPADREQLLRLVNALGDAFADARRSASADRASR